MGATRWWRELAQDESDPISLEPLHKLRHEPFRLPPLEAVPQTQGSRADASAPVVAPASEDASHASRLAAAAEAPCAGLFDAKVLAAYLLSTRGQLRHPVSRRSLTRSDCEVWCLSSRGMGGLRALLLQRTSCVAAGCCSEPCVQCRHQVEMTLKGEGAKPWMCA